MISYQLMSVSLLPLAGKDLLLCAIFGGVISGAGSGFAIRYGGAIDGIEIIANIFAKKTRLDRRHIYEDIQYPALCYLRYCN